MYIYIYIYLSRLPSPWQIIVISIRQVITSAAGDLPGLGWSAVRSSGDKNDGQPMKGNWLVNDQC